MCLPGEPGSTLEMELVGRGRSYCFTEPIAPPSASSREDPAGRGGPVSDPGSDEWGRESRD